MAGYCLAFFLLIAYLSPLYVPHNQLTVHRGSAILRPVPISHSFGFQLKELDWSGSGGKKRLALFVPGHKGDVKQAISMTRFFEREGVVWDVYSVDFGEGAVAISADLARAEAEFVSQCLQYIAQQRKGPITVIAHSMGGIVTSLALAMASTPTHRVTEVIALSTPFSVPPVATSLSISSLYRDVHLFWRSPQAHSLFLLSFSGGIRDLTVPSSTSNSACLSSPYSLHFQTTAIQDLYLELDHLATVWGLEFFTQLTKAMVIIGKDKGAERNVELVKEKLTNRLGKTLYYKPEYDFLPEKLPAKPTIDIDFQSEVVLKPEFRYRLQSFPVLILSNSDLPAIFSQISDDFVQIRPISTQIETSNIAILRDFPIIYLESTHENQRIQPILCLFSDLNWLKTALFGAVYHHKSSDFAVKLTPGRSFSSYRYPLHVSVSSEFSQIKAVHAKCSSEEIVKFNENDFTLYFNGNCEEGPEIYVLGFDGMHEYEVKLGVNWMGVLVTFTRDFRMNIITASIGWGLISLSELSTRYRVGVVGVTCAVVMLFGDRLRVSMWPWDLVTPAPALDVLELVYILLVGRSLSAVVLGMIACAYQVAGLLRVSIPVILQYLFPLLSLCTLYSYPYPTLLLTVLFRLIHDSNTGQIHRPGLLFPFILLISTLPETLGWILVLIDHKVPLPLTFPDGFIVISMLFALIFPANRTEKWVLIPSGVLILLCGYEFPYRANAILAFLCVFQSLFSLISTRFKSKSA